MNQLLIIHFFVQQDKKTALTIGESVVYLSLNAFNILDTSALARYNKFY